MLKIVTLIYFLFLTGCSIAYELVAPVANFGLGLYNADTYVTKDCQWYEPVWFSYNNDLALELCKNMERGSEINGH